MEIEVLNDADMLLDRLVDEEPVLVDDGVVVADAVSEFVFESDRVKEAEAVLLILVDAEALHDVDNERDADGVVLRVVLALKVFDVLSVNVDEELCETLGVWDIVRDALNDIEALSD
jgi:succinylarginine dihydrolase